jgi:hypothetical protein
MRDRSGVAAGRGWGTRSAALFLGLAPLAGLLAACGGAGGGPGGPEDSDLIVKAVTPTNGQETLANMSDPEVGGRLTMKFTGLPMASSMIDNTNAFNGLTPNVQILDQSFSRVPGTPSVDKSSRAFTFTPQGGVLPPAQYTVTVSKFVSSSGGKLLNNGVEDYSASWTVGPDVYPPVIRNTSPAANQSEVPIYTPIVITFNESLDPASVVLGQTVFVEDGGVNPVQPVNGTLALKRDGFDMVFTPDPCVGMPPSTTVVVRLLATGSVSFIRDKIGNGLVGDGATNQKQFQFNTRGVKPLPIAANMNTPGSLAFNLAPMLAFVSNQDKTFAFDIRAVILEFAVRVRTDVTLVQQVLANNRRPIPIGNTWGYGNQYGGDWESKVGQVGESVLDWRLDTTLLQTYIYQIDEVNEQVAIINTGTGKTEGRFKGIGTPRGIGITGFGGTGTSPTLFISNYGQGTVTVINLGSFQPGLPICTAVKELNDDAGKRAFVETGSNPAGVAAQFQGLPIAGVVNQGDGEFQVFDPATLQPINRAGIGNLASKYAVGENPIDCTFTAYDPFNGWQWAYVVNQGGPQTPKGSVSVWWNASTTFGPFNSRSGSIINTITDSIDVPGHAMADPQGLNCFIPNTASDGVTELIINIEGGFIFTRITATVRGTREVGPNPTSFTFAGSPILPIGVATLAGSGQVAFYELNGTVSPPVLFNIPGVRTAFTMWNQ